MAATDRQSDIERTIQARLGAHGLTLRGGVNFRDDEPAILDCARFPVASALLIGNAGGAFWPHFQAWRGNQPAELANPLDTWSREIIGVLADDVGALAVFPSDRPYLPFQRWAMRAEGLKPSPLGVLMHPEYGLWHAYRGALLFDRAMDLALPVSTSHLCDGCHSQPCRKTCPVGAHSGATFQYQDCLGYLRSNAESTCMSAGCLDRNACPYGLDHRYPPDLQAFLMSAFAR